MVLLALVGADYTFIWIDTGEEGHRSDGQLVGASELKECIDDNTINFPDSDPLPNDDRDTPYYILGSKGQWHDGGQLHHFQGLTCGGEWFRNTGQQMEMLPGHPGTRT